MPMATTSTPSTPPIPISDDGRPPSTTMLQEELDALERRFVGHDGDELMMSVKQLVIEHITRPENDE